MDSFQSVLNIKSEDVKPPKPLPQGTYLCIVDGMPEFRQMGKEQNWGAIFKFKALQAQPDVDQPSLLEALDGKNLAEIPIQTTYWITVKARYRLKKFLVDGLGIEENGRMLNELIPEAQGRQCMVSIGHRPSDVEGVMYMDVKDIARV